MHTNRLLAAVALLTAGAATASHASPTAFGWGTENRGELGNGSALTGLAFPLPVLDAAGSCCLGTLVDLQSGIAHVVAIDGAQRVWTWGDNEAGQLGIGALAPAARALPGQVPGFVARLPASPQEETIAAGGGHVLAIDAAGALWSWGLNQNGQLGIGPPGAANCGTPPNARPCRTAPVAVALQGPVRGVGAGEHASFAIVGDCATGPAAAWAWGAGGQLGDGTSIGRDVPVAVQAPLGAGALTGVAKIVAGAGHAVALLCNGEVLAWGANGQGQLGHGNTAASLVAGAVVTQCGAPPRPLLGCPLTDIVDIAAGPTHSLAIDAQGRLWAWGDNGAGQLCTGGPDLVFATQIFGGARATTSAGLPLDAVAGGAGFSLVLLANQTLVGCGLNVNGQLGDCTQTSSALPVSVRAAPACTAPLSGVLLVEAGEDHGLLLAADGSPTPTATPRPPTPTPTPPPPTPTRPPTATASASATTTPSATVSATPSRTATPTASATATVCVPPPAGMVAWLPFDSSGIDLSFTGNTAVLQGGATYGPGQVGDALLLGAAADFAALADDPSLDFAGDFSLDAWIRTTSFSTLGIIDKRTGSTGNPTGYHLFLFGGQLGFQLADGQPFLNHTAPAPLVNDGQWHHVAVTVERGLPSGGILYVDGSAVLTFDPTTRPGSIASAAPLRIGQRHLSSPNPFSGAIDEVELFARALGAAELQGIAAAGRGGKCKPATPSVTATPSATATVTGTPTTTRTTTRTASVTRTPTRTPGCAPTPLGMVAWWPLDEPAGTSAQDLAAAPNTGTHVAGPLAVAGRVQGARRYDGTDDHSVVADHAELNFGTGDLSIDLWVRTTAATGIAPLIDKRQVVSNLPRGYTLFLRNGRPVLQLADALGGGFTDYSTTTSVADGQWHHVAATVRRAGAPQSLVMYVDGVAVLSSATPRPGTISSSAPLWIGRRHPLPGALTPRWFAGELDEIELFARALSGAEVADLFGAGAAGKCRTPVATPTRTATRPVTPVTPNPFPCDGDCDDDGAVTIGELVTGVGIALGGTPAGSCVALDADGDGRVAIGELIRAVGRALGGCPVGAVSRAAPGRSARR